LRGDDTTQRRQYLGGVGKKKKAADDFVCGLFVSDSRRN